MINNHYYKRNIVDNAEYNAAFKRLFQPTASELRSQLVEIGDGLAAAFHALHNDATPDRAEQLALRLQGCARFCMQLRSALLSESQPWTGV